jgi:Flp pilus assembly protein protease CpaA
MGVAGLAQVAVLGVCLATAAAWDLWKRRIPNSVNVATAVLGLGAALATGSLTVVAHSLAGAGVVFGVLLLMYRQRWIGGGDVKLGVAFGTWLGPVGGLSALVVGIAFNGIVAVYLLVRGGSAFRAEVKSNLVMAAYTGRVGETEHRPDSAHIPLGAALAASALVVFIVRGGVGA